MSAERGWIAEPQPARQWHDSHYSREADRIAARDREVAVTDDETHAAEVRTFEEVPYSREFSGLVKGFVAGDMFTERIAVTTAGSSGSSPSARMTSHSV
jgi:hypothetical protein